MATDRKFIKTKYRGVYYRESPARTHAGRPDRCFSVWYTDAHGKGRWETVGWASEGINDKYANAKRQELVSAIARGNDPARQRRFTVGQAIEAYTVWAKAEGKAIDRETARYDLHMRPEMDALPIEALTTHMLAQLKARLLERLSAGSVHHCFSFVRRAIYHAMSEGLYSGGNPVATTRSSKWKMPRVQNSGVRFLSPEEARILLDELAGRSQQLHDMSLLSLKTGLRAAEIFTIRAQDVQAEAGLIHFTGKGGSREHVHASREITDMLAAYPRKPGEHIFQVRARPNVKPSANGRITWGISSTFSRAVDKLGLNAGVTDRRHRVWFHTWRHTFASWLAQSGKVTLLELKELMRHESISMTERYAHLIPGHQKKKLGIIDEVLLRESAPDQTPKS